MARRAIALLLLCSLVAELCAQQVVVPLKRKPNSLLAKGDATSEFIKRTRPYFVDAGQPIATPLGGSILSTGEYFATIGLGTPAQTFEVQVDTGSSDLLVYSVDCVGCGKNKKHFYNRHKSSTARSIPCDDHSYDCETCEHNKDYCGFDDLYGDGSEVKGRVLLESFQLAEMKANVTFGMIEHSSPHFEPKSVDGIWGLAYQVLSDWKGPTSWQLWAAANNVSDVFGMCLVGAANASLAPVMTLGGDYSNNPNFKFTNVVKELYYGVRMTDVLVAGKSIGVSPSIFEGGPGTIVDSGTTLVYIPNKAVEAVYERMHAMCDSTNLVGVCGVPADKSLFAGQCFAMTDAQIAEFPTLSFVLDPNVQLDVGPQMYLLAEQGEVCLGILGSGGVDGGVILGDVLMQGYNVIFDRANKKVGFGSLSTCPQP